MAPSDHPEQFPGSGVAGMGIPSIPPPNSEGREICIITILRYYKESGYIDRKRVLGWFNRMVDAEEALRNQFKGPVSYYDHVVLEILREGIRQKALQSRWFRITEEGLVRTETPSNLPKCVGMGE